MIKIDFNQGWFFGKMEGEKQPVSIPHDAMIHEKRQPQCENGRTTGYYPGEKYCYEKRFVPQKHWMNQKILLQFEGVYQNAVVFFNGEKLAEQPYGYTSFYVDVSKCMDFSGENELRIEVDNEREPSSRWYSGTGIYRPVYLWVGDRAGLMPENICIETLSHEPAQLQVKVKASLSNPRINQPRIETSVQILDQNQNQVAAFEGMEGVVTIEHPSFWSEENPYLYTCKVVRTSGQETVDEIEVACGICHIQWSTRGFLVNGQEVKLRGACIHHDNGILGACEYQEAANRRVGILKEAGFNAVRSAHNPISHEILQACDEQGMYVMDEFADMWYEHKNSYDYATYFEAWHEKDLTAMVQKDYHHPSVIMYSIGNEVTETKDEWGICLTREMTDLVHSLDASRPVTCGINMALNTMHFAGLGVYQPREEEPERKPQKKNPKAMALMMEMAKEKQVSLGANNNQGHDSSQIGPTAMGLKEDMGQRKQGKLVGSEYFNEMMVQMKEQQRMVVTQPIAKILSEEAYEALDIAGYNYADGRYLLDAEEYPNRVSVGSETLPQKIYRNWNLVQQCSNVIGDFMWTGWDYIGEAGIGVFCYDSVGSKDKEYPTLLAGCGVIDITGLQRPEVWLNKITYGLENGPYIGVEPVTHSQEEHLISAWRFSDAIHSWNWPGCEGNKADVIVYTNGREVELFRDSQSLGRSQVAENQAKFQTIYQPGELKAVAYDEQGKVLGWDVLKSGNGEQSLQIDMSKEELSGDGQDLIYVDLSVIDEDGVVVASAREDVEVEISGNITLAGFGNADPFHEQGYSCQIQPTYYGRAQAIIRAGMGSGEACVKIKMRNQVYQKNILVM